jgi:hypothetical protein
MTSKLQKFRVLREHDGDRFYAEGEIREATPADVAHLVGKVLEPMVEEPEAEAAKAEPAPANKAEGSAPANKAASRKKAATAVTKG